jgi:alpha-1,2-mannosyltransferase
LHNPAALSGISRAGLKLAARRLRPRRWLAAGGVALWLLDLVTQIANVLPFWMDDAQSYAAAGRHLLAGQPLYAPFQLAAPYLLGDAAWGLGFVYPPTAALLFVPLAPLGPAAVALVFGAAWVLFALLAFRVARRSGLEPRASALLTLVLTFSGPAINAVSSGNVNIMIADALLASWLWPRSSGTLAVLGGLIKFFPVAGLVWTLRHHGSLRWPIALGLGILAASILAVGTAGWGDFLTAFGHGRSSSFYYLPSPTQLLEPGIGQVAGYGLALAALAGAWRLRDEAAAFALLGWAMILPAPDWWSHYLVVPLAAMLPWAARALTTRRHLAEPVTQPGRRATAFVPTQPELHSRNVSPGPKPKSGNLGVRRAARGAGLGFVGGGGRADATYTPEFKDEGAHRRGRRVYARSTTP